MRDDYLIRQKPMHALLVFAAPIILGNLFQQTYTMVDSAMVGRFVSEQALAAVIARFSAYVVTVIHNRSRRLLSPEDEDELASSTFFALWQSCRTVKAGSIRAWLGSVARNKTVDRLRKARMDMPLDEELAGTDDFLLEETVKKEQARQLREAVALLQEPDREIIRRFYDLCQTAPEIAAALDLTPAAVRMRLVRSREAIRNELCRGGFAYE